MDEQLQADLLRAKIKSEELKQTLIETLIKGIKELVRKGVP